MSVATIIAERLGAAVGALVATLPVSAGPVYVFLALDHDVTFISVSAVVSLALNAATAVFVTVYVLMAQRRSLSISVSLAFTAWLEATLALGPVHWSAPSALVLTLLFRPLLVDRQTVLPGTHAIDDTALIRLRSKGGHGDTAGRRGRDPKFSNWSDGKRRACCIPDHLHKYYGDLASPRRRSRQAAVLANAVPGLAGFGAALLTLHLTAVPLGSALALIVALGVSVAWNACLYATRHYESFA